MSNYKYIILYLLIIIAVTNLIILKESMSVDDNLSLQDCYCDSLTQDMNYFN